MLNIDSGNGLMPDGNKPLPEPMLELMISEVLWYSFQGIFIGNAQEIYPWYEFKNYLFKMTAPSRKS